VLLLDETLEAAHGKKGRKDRTKEGGREVRFENGERSEEGRESECVREEGGKERRTET